MSNHLCFHPFQPIILFLTCDNVKPVTSQISGSEKPRLFSEQARRRIKMIMLNAGHAGIACTEGYHTSFAGDL